MQHPLLLTQPYHFNEAETTQKLEERAEQSKQGLLDSGVTEDKANEVKQNVHDKGPLDEGYFAAHFMYSFVHDSGRSIRIEKTGPFIDTEQYWTKVSDEMEAEQEAISFILSCEPFDTVPMHDEDDYDLLHNFAAKMQMAANSIAKRTNRSPGNLLVGSIEDEKLLENSAATKVYDTYLTPSMPAGTLAFVYVNKGEKTQLEGPFLYCPCEAGDGPNWFGVTPETDEHSWRNYIAILKLDRGEEHAQIQQGRNS
jgi:hypothetical protein